MPVDPERFARYSGKLLQDALEGVETCQAEFSCAADLSLLEYRQEDLRLIPPPSGPCRRSWRMKSRRVDIGPEDVLVAGRLPPPSPSLPEGRPLSVQDGRINYLTEPGGLPPEQVDSVGTVLYCHQDVRHEVA